MSKLHELAERMGVETLYRAGDDVPHVFYIGNHRPDFEIAHDMHEKLKVEGRTKSWSLDSVGWQEGWSWSIGDDADKVEYEEGTGPFIECVCELASRHIGERE